MITYILKEYWGVLIIVALFAALAFETTLYLDKRDELTAYQASIKQLADDTAAENARIARVQLQNLDILRKDYEINEPKIRADAVDAYLARRLRTDATRGSTMPTNAAGIRPNDGATKECVPDSTFIADAASDANTLAEWQAYAKLNNLPVKD